MRSVLIMKYAILVLCRLLRSIESQGVTCRKRKAITSSQLCPSYLSNVSDISNHPLTIRVWITLDPFTFRFAEALKKDGDFFFTCLTTRACTLRLYHLWTEVLVSLTEVLGIERFIARRGIPSTI